MKTNQRTHIDFSNHQIEVIKFDGVLIHKFYQPNTRINGITFINTCGILTVTGDFGNWVFSREFHPTPEGYVSGQYWDEKLQIASQQKALKYDSEETMNLIEKFVAEFEEGYGREMSEEEKDWIDNLKNSVDDEFDYKIVAYRENYYGFDYENVPYGESRHFWLDVVYDAFDAICKRLKES